MTLEECEREHILRALGGTRWIVGGPNGAAAMLGVKRTTLIWKMQKLDIARKAKGRILTEPPEIFSLSPRGMSGEDWGIQ